MTSTSKPLAIKLFGNFEITVESTPLRKLRTHRGHTVLAILALRMGKQVDRTYLAETVWPDSALPDALYSLRRTLTDLRQALGEHSKVLVSPSVTTIQLDPTLVWVDVHHLDQVLKNQGPDEVARAFQHYRGPLLEEWNQEWVLLERSFRHRSIVEGIGKLADRSELSGDSQGAAECLKLLSTLDPHDEGIFKRLFANLIRSGNQPAAQKAYDEFRKRLRQDLEIYPSNQTQEFVREMLVPLQKSSDPNRYVGGNLPLPTTPLIGRAAEMRETLDELAAGRMVTLVGSGGIGKTRLALEVVRELAATRSSKAIAVDLLPVRDPDHLSEALAAASKSIDPEPNGSPSKIVSRLASANALVLLDNCEHLLDPVRILVQELLDSCPQILILATSQAPIGVPQERVLRLAPMAVPDHADLSLEQAQASDAIKLMTQRIAKAKGNFELTEKNCRVVRRICKILEGVPLAIELAATRTKLLSLEQVADLLDDRFRLLRTNDKGVEERHRTLQATVEWSYSLLSDDERSLLQTASVFAGYWTSESIAAVHQETDSYHVIELLERLVDRSLILADVDDDLPRFRMLDSVRQFALDRLTDGGRAVEVRNRHLQWFSDLAVRASQHFTGKDQVLWIERITAEYENIPAALAWAKHSKSMAGPALLLTSSLFRFWWQRGELTTGREILKRILELDDAKRHKIPYASALYAYGALAWSQGDNEEACSYQRQALGIFEAEGDKRGAAGCLRNLCQATRNQGDLNASLDFGMRALKYYKEIGPETLAAYTLTDLGIVAADLLMFELSMSYLEEAIRFSRVHQVTSLEAVALLNYGSISHSQGKLEQAKVALTGAMELYEKVGGLILSTMTRNALAEIHAKEGDIPLAKQFLANSFGTFLDLGEKKGVCLTLESVSIIACEAKLFEHSASWLGTTDQMRQDLEIPRSPAEQGPYLRQVQSCVEGLGKALFDRHYQDGRMALSTVQVDEASQWLSEP